MYLNKGPTCLGWHQLLNSSFVDELNFNNYYEHLMDIKEKGKIWLIVIDSFQFWVVWSFYKLSCKLAGLTSIYFSGWSFISNLSLPSLLRVVELTRSLMISSLLPIASHIVHIDKTKMRTILPIMTVIGFSLSQWCSMLHVTSFFRWQ